MSKGTLVIVQLYPKNMNIYGDWGNTLTLKRRIEWHGYDVKLVAYNPGDTFPEEVDIIVGGGGQDSGQAIIANDLRSIGPRLIDFAQDGVPMLMICGLYQLFGHFFKTREGVIIQGIGLLDVETVGGTERMIGNITTSSDEFGDIIGYENHSGQTTLGPLAQPLGVVLKGAGNNGQDAFEGARFKNVIGTYLHGSLLPKNPMIADWIIKQAAIRKYGDFSPLELDDRLADQARKIALTRPR